ncbi:MAG: CDP-alcohol phosphatidyltransferase family protein [Burkholderiales bacterium]|jgi:phosphatidylglycerophosphate synthase|nr:CDP-alcohol phosphatidyltransferase family protein [Burkholderiales bacterium]
MLDGFMRRLVDPPLNAAAAMLVRGGVGADAVTAASVACGLGCAAAIAVGLDGFALLLLALGRIGDGLDGAIARITRRTDRGGLADIVGDFMFYGAVPLAFALRAPDANALAAAWLLFSFYVNGASFLAYAAIAAKRGLTTEVRGAKSIYFTAGLAEGTETILVFVAMILLPGLFTPLAVAFGVLCLVTAGARVVIAWRTFD